MNKKLALILALILTLFLMGSVSAGFFDFLNFGGDSHSNSNVVEDGQYCTADEVAAYIKEFHKLPSNYITKSEARNLGWQGGPLKNYAPGNFPDYYGKNLDALYDCLCEIGIETQIVLVNSSEVSKDVIDTFVDASAENELLDFKCD